MAIAENLPDVLAVNLDVNVYTRHRPGCLAFADPHYRKCGCPKWLYIKDGCRRVSAKTTIWAVAETKAQAVRDKRDPVKQRLAELEKKLERKRVLIDFAIARFLPSNQRSPSTLKNYSGTLGRMKEYLLDRGIFYLDEIIPEHLSDWTATPAWTTQSIRYNRVRRTTVTTFFRFCVRRMKWLSFDQDPSGGLPQFGDARAEPIVPFEFDEYEAILAATARFDAATAATTSFHSNQSVKEKIVNGERLRTFIQVMRWSGLAIRDTVMLQRSQLNESVLGLRRAKTGTPVTVPLPVEIAEELRGVSVPDAHPRYFFANLRSKPASQAGLWSGALLKLWPLVQWPRPLETGHGPVRPHSHMFRHTFGKEFLQAGGDIRALRDLMGHSSIKTTEQSYGAFMPERARRLNEMVHSTFAAQRAPGHRPKRKSQQRRKPRQIKNK
jgi:integrase/recombinase XerD